MVVPFGGSYLGSYMVIPKGTTMDPACTAAKYLAGRNPGHTPAIPSSPKVKTSLRQRTAPSTAPAAESILKRCSINLPPWGIRTAYCTLSCTLQGPGLRESRGMSTLWLPTLNYRTSSCTHPHMYHMNIQPYACCLTLWYDMIWYHMFAMKWQNMRWHIMIWH